MARANNATQTLCWDCKNAVPSEKNGCNWSRYSKPVEGWDIKVSPPKRSAVNSLYKYKGTTVLTCPEFVKG